MYMWLFVSLECVCLVCVPNVFLVCDHMYMRLYVSLECVFLECQCLIVCLSVCVCARVRVRVCVCVSHRASSSAGMVLISTWGCGGRNR
jgi:hypothetical protein